jgi:hypothetical protein
VVRRGERHTKFWWGNLKERAYMEDVSVDGGGGVKMVCNEIGWRGWGRELDSSG